MARYEIIQSDDISSLRDIKNATLVVSRLRRGILEKDPKDLERNLRLSARLQPAASQLQEHLRRVEAHEEHPVTFAERAGYVEPSQNILADLRQQIARLPDENAGLLRVVQSTPTDDTAMQDQLGRNLVLLDQIDTSLRHLHRVIQQRQQASGQALKRDQERAEHMTTITGIVTLMAFLIAIGTVWRGLAPIGRLTRATAQVGEGQFDIERVRAGHDEIGQLAEAFHHMTRALSQREIDLQRANAAREAVYQRLLEEEKSRIKAEQLAAIGALSSRITHELRNPLSSLSLNIDMILDDPHLPSLEADTREMLLSIQDEIVRLEALSSGYLDLTKVQTPKAEPLDFSDLLKNTMFQLEPSMLRAQITWTPSLATALWVAGDANALRGVLINLLENARLALEARPLPRMIHITLTQEDAHLSCAIEDNGPGVSDGIRHRLFEPFASDREGGTGLGLSTSREVMHAHGGTLTYTPSELGGACFRMRLPILTNATADRQGQ